MDFSCPPSTNARRSYAAAAGHPWSSTHRLLWLWIVLGMVCWMGCASQRYVVQRTAPVNPLAESLNFKNREGPQPTARTMTLLRHYDVLDVYKRDPETALDMLQELATDEKGAEKVYAIAELAYIVGKRYESERSMGKALDWYTVAVANAYLYLFSPELDGTRNPYDPQFRGACDLYNVALESTLKLVSREGNLRPGHSYRISTQEQQHEVQVVTRGPWRDEDFGELKFCSEYQVKLLDAVNVTYGIGVPMIAVRNNQDPNERGSKYYPEGLSFPVTAILRVTTPNVHSRREDHHRHPCVLELHDPLSSTDVELNSRLVPLQSDLSTPLAYFLDNPKFRQQTDSWIGLVDPNKTEKLRGIYMLEPYDPNRIPVVMVHGLWSSPLTWMPMFNDLRSFRELRKNYQFWFYQYPTGQPFWVSSAQMRSDLQELKQNLDPQGQHALLNQMVLVGHSMGGLVSRMQTLESGDEFWRILSDEPFEKIQAKPEEKEKLESALFFHPNPSIQRVITIGTPHRGSDYSNDYTQWLGRKLITLPTSLTEMGNSLIRQNPGVFRDTGLLVTKTSIDSLSPDSPIFPAMLRARRASWVRYHNIIGILDKTRWFQSEDSESDGVVDVSSSHMDDVESEIVVSAGHSSIHTQPRTILEVRRILVEHLHEACQRPDIASCLEVPETWRFPEHQPPATPYHLVKSRVGSRHWVGGGQLGSSLPKIYPLKLKTPWGATKQGRGEPGPMRAPGANADGSANGPGGHPLFPSHAHGGVITVSGIETSDAAVVPAVGPIPAPMPSASQPRPLPPLLPSPMSEPAATAVPGSDGVRISGGQISSRPR
ncbi:MAG: esterase/lipase family protein [Pirellula sp.]